MTISLLVQARAEAANAIREVQAQHLNTQEQLDAAGQQLSVATATNEALGRELAAVKDIQSQLVSAFHQQNKKHQEELNKVIASRL